MPWISACFYSTNLTCAGVLRCPLNGTGVRYGLSVSIRRRSNGTASEANLGPSAFLKVMGPANEI